MEVAMPNIRRVSPLEAKQLVDEGYTYVDVRTAQEFDARHPTGALNVPLALMGPAGPAPNVDFLPIMLRLFGLEAKIVVGCATGMRSRRAAEMLSAEGFLDVADQRAGLDGARGPFGGAQEPGWAAAGLPTASGPDEGSYGRVKARTST
jgi:rhodanese-related sulfurtransferase